MAAPDVDYVLERPRNPEHGDLATNVAMQLAPHLKRKPREIAQELVDAFEFPESFVSNVEIAGPGFINFKFGSHALLDVLVNICELGCDYGRADVGKGKSVNVEFVSANPTGPLHVGHGRGAALGDAVASLLEAMGHDVTREFYVNDAGLQVERLGLSLWARIQQLRGSEAEVPEGGYHGEYLIELAKRVIEHEGSEFADLPEEVGVGRCREIAVEDQRKEQTKDLADFRVKFDCVFSERELYAGDEITASLEALNKRGLTYESDGALWLRTSEWGDTKDRVLRKSDGTFTYFLPDIAYHRNKAGRHFDRAIDVWGADHHGYISRMRAALKGLGLEDSFFDVILVQLVKVMRDGSEVKFSKRTGDFVTLRALFEETGVDAARYFFLTRRGDGQFVFDVDLAKKQSDENPVYYVQYAHTRMAGIFRKAEVDPTQLDLEGADLSLLTEEDERALMKHLGLYPEMLVKAADTLEPYRVTIYLDELARLVNGWYHRHRVIGSPADLERARMILARAAQIVLSNGLNLLGVTAPERM